MTTTDQVFAALCNKAESYDGVIDGSHWFTVYLDNARPAGMNDKQFRACLSALSKRGDYRVIDGWAWGQVRMNEEAAKRFEG